MTALAYLRATQAASDDPAVRRCLDQALHLELLDELMAWTPFEVNTFRRWPMRRQFATTLGVRICHKLSDFWKPGTII